MRLDNRVLGNSKPNNSWQDLTISILLVLKSFIKKSVNSKVQLDHLTLNISKMAADTAIVTMEGE